MSQIQYNSTIDTNDKLQVKYWTARFNVSSQQLVGAVKATGSNNVAVIEEYLFERKNRPRRKRYISQV